MKKIVDFITEFVTKSQPIFDVLSELKTEFGKLFSAVGEIIAPIKELLQSFGFFNSDMSLAEMLVKNFTSALKLAIIPIKAVLWVGTQFAKIIGKGIASVIDRFKMLVRFIAVVAKKLGFDDAAKKMQNFADGTKEAVEAGNAASKIATKISRGSNGTKLTSPDITTSDATTTSNSEFTTPAKPTETAITGVQNQSPKSVIINIDSLIEEFTVSTTNLTQGMSKIQEIVTKTILQGVNDASLTIEGQ